MATFLSLTDLVDRLEQLSRRRHWRRLEQLVRDHYSDLLVYVHTCANDPTSQRVARSLELCFQHISNATDSNTDFKTSMVMDFGNFILDTLTPGAFVPRINVHTTHACCTLCMLPLSETDENESGWGVMVHRDCGQPMAHVRCFQIWTDAGGASRCHSCT